MTISRTLRITLVTAVIAGVSLTTMTGGLALAQDAPTTNSVSQEASSQGIGTITQLSSAEFVVQTAPGVNAAVTETGATLSQNGAVQALPTSATDSTGAAVQLRYVQSGDGLHIQVIDPAKVAASPDSGSVAARGIFQCILGTGGGAGGGGLAGAGVGSAIPGLGTAAGAIIGGVSGAATGAAASCF